MPGRPAKHAEKPHFRLMAAPRRARAWRRSSSAISGRPSAIRAATAGSGGGGGVAGSRRRSGAWRSAICADRLPAEEAIDPLQDHRRQMLDLERRRAFHPQHQRGRFRGLVARARGQLILIGSLWAATSGPTMSPQRARISAEAKPCDLRASLRVAPRKSESGRGKLRGALLMGGALMPSWAQ